MADQDSEPLSVPFQTYVDKQLEEVRRAAQLASEVPPPESVPLREFVEAILNEQRRGIEVAEREREKAAQALAKALTQQIAQGDFHLSETLAASVDEARRGLSIAEQEREKAAKALRQELARAIEDGDKNLREHIEQQIQQIHAALVSAEKLELQRFSENDRRIKDVLDAANDRLEAVRREVILIQESAAAAIAKAEAANERRFESVNEFRAQLAEQTASFLPREVADAQFSELRRALQDVTEKLGRVVS